MPPVHFAVDDDEPFAEALAKGAFLDVSIGVGLNGCLQPSIFPPRSTIGWSCDTTANRYTLLEQKEMARRIFRIIRAKSFISLGGQFANPLYAYAAASGSGLSNVTQITNPVDKTVSVVVDGDARKVRFLAGLETKDTCELVKKVAREMGRGSLSCELRVSPLSVDVNKESFFAGDEIIVSVKVRNNTSRVLRFGGNVSFQNSQVFRSAEKNVTLYGRRAKTLSFRLIAPFVRSSKTFRVVFYGEMPFVSDKWITISPAPGEPIPPPPRPDEPIVPGEPVEPVIPSQGNIELVSYKLSGDSFVPNEEIKVDVVLRNVSANTISPFLELQFEQNGLTFPKPAVSTKVSLSGGSSKQVGFVLKAPKDVSEQVFLTGVLYVDSVPLHLGQISVDPEGNGNGNGNGNGLGEFVPWIIGGGVLAVGGYMAYDMIKDKKRGKK